jgi:hypothetical protein
MPTPDAALLPFSLLPRWNLSLASQRAGLLVTALTAASTLGGCATYAEPVPVPLEEGVYSVESSGRGNEAYQGAIRFCFDQGRQLLRVDGQARGSAPVGGQIRFRCVGPGERGWKEPVG